MPAIIPTPTTATTALRRTGLGRSYSVTAQRRRLVGARNARRDTNTANIQAGTIFPYVGSAGVYRCPADRSESQGTGRPRTRNYSIEGWLNAYYKANGFDIGPEFYERAKLRFSEVQVPPPAGVFAFLDQNERSIEAGVFVLEQKDSNVWPSLPADRHRQGANISFLDGHAEHWLWKARKTYREFYAPAQSDSDVQDMRRLQAALPQNDTPKSAPNP